MGFLARLVSDPLTRWLTTPTQTRTFPLSHFDRIRQELKPCDVLLVAGRSRISEVVKVVTQSAWSHAALYVGRLHDIEDDDARAMLAVHVGERSPGEQFVIESHLGQGTIARPLAAYREDHLRICRPAGLSLSDARTILAYAASRLNTPYDVRQILDLARFLLPWGILPRRWRSSLFRASASKATRTVCSTMIAEAFNAVQFPILPLVQADEDGQLKLFRRNPKLCTPSDFDYSPYFEIINYAFMDFGHHANYRLLPWSEADVGGASGAAQVPKDALAAARRRPEEGELP